MPHRAVSQSLRCFCSIWYFLWAKTNVFPAFSQIESLSLKKIMYCNHIISHPQKIINLFCPQKRQKSKHSADCFLLKNKHFLFLRYFPGEFVLSLRIFVRHFFYFDIFYPQKGKYYADYWLFIPEKYTSIVIIDQGEGAK